MDRVNRISAIWSNGIDAMIKELEGELSALQAELDSYPRGSFGEAQVKLVISWINMKIEMLKALP